MQSRSCSRLGGLVLVLTVLGAISAAPASGALPRTYQVQRVDSASPQANGRFGLGLVNVGDVNGDGRADLLTGTDKHGTVLGQGQVAVISGANGSVLRTYGLPDADPGTSGAGGDRPSGFGAAVTRIDNIGGCPGFTGQPGAACPAVAPTTDNVPDHAVSASGVDLNVGTGAPDPALNNSLGVVYVFDGPTGALLKRIIMPAADRVEQTTGATAGDPRYGRTLLSPGDIVGAGGALGTDGRADLLVGVTDYNETRATAHPESPCATANPTPQPCSAAGRIYLYSGVDIATGGPGTTLAIPARTIKNPLSTPNNPAAVSPFANSVGFATLLIPVGDSGQCTSAAPANPAGACATRSNNPDMRPEFAVASPGVDRFGMEEVGAVVLIDGGKLSTLKRVDYPEPHPEASWGQAQNGTVYPAVGDLAGSTQPDIYMPDIQWNGPGHAAQGRGFVIDGTPGSVGSFREFPSRFVDPTPQTGEQFGLSAAPIGNVGGADDHNELLIGAIGPHNPGTNPNVVNDVSIFDPITEAALQSVQAPDAQGGEGFGTALAPLGDVNGDGFQDFAAGAGFHDLANPGAGCNPCTNAGRVYVFRSDNSPAPPAGQPSAPGAPAPPIVVAGRALELEASPARVRSGRRVRLRGVLEAFANEAACEPNQQVELQRRRPGSLRYRTFRRVRTTAGGGFSARIRPRRTYLYRASVPRTGACAGAASPRERVTVVRRRNTRRR